MEVKEGKRKEAVEELMEIMEVKVELEEVWRMGGDKREGREMLWVKLRSVEQRGEVFGEEEEADRKERDNIRGRRKGKKV